MDTVSQVCFHCESTNTKMRTFPWSYRPKAKSPHKPEETEIQISFCDSCYPFVQYAHFYGHDWWDAVDGVELYFQYTTCHLCGDKEKGLPRKLPFDDRHPFDYPYYCDSCFQRLQVVDYSNEEETILSLHDCILDALNKSTQHYHHHSGNISFNIKKMGSKLVRLSNVSINGFDSKHGQFAIYHIENKSFIKRLWMDDRRICCVSPNSGSYLDNLIILI